LSKPDATPFLPLVACLAQRASRRAPSSIEQDDLESVGTLALIEALDRFDPSRGVPVAAYLRLRIRGAMVDHLRRAGPVVRTRSRGGHSREHRFVALGDQEDFLDRLVEDGPGADQRLVQHEADLEIQDLVETLPDGERELVRGHDLEGRPLQRVATELGITPTQASKLRSQALYRMRRGLRAA
jgi:RNA polymerase sigma factor FliA